MSPQAPVSVHDLHGPDGGKLLGFLATLGTLAVLSDIWPDRRPQVSWVFRTGWRPVLGFSRKTSEDEIVQALDQELRRHANGPEFVQLGDDLPVDFEVFRMFAESAATAASRNSRRWADFAAAWGSDALRDGEDIQDTDFRTMSGAGHQHFLAFMRELVQLTRERDLRSALFTRWTYTDDRPSMRWDEVDDRRYAYRSDDPAKSKAFPIRTVRGANRLAVEALRCFPVVPQGARLATTGFEPPSRRRRYERRVVSLRWPIWNGFLTVSTAKSLLALPHLWRDPVPTDQLHEMGVVEVFECRRVTEGYVRSFTPARALFGVVVLTEGA
jgi:hypothetical protein